MKKTTVKKPKKKSFASAKRRKWLQAHKTVVSIVLAAVFIVALLAIIIGVVVKSAAEKTRNQLASANPTPTTEATTETIDLAGVSDAQEPSTEEEPTTEVEEEPTEEPTDVPITVTWNNMDNTGYGIYSQDGVTMTPSNGDAHSTYNLYDYGDNTFSTTSGKFTKIEIICTYGNMSGWDKESLGQYQPYPDMEPDYWQDIWKLTWTGEAETVTIHASIFGIQSITFTIE